jgi:hypothetical protein
MRSSWVVILSVWLLACGDDGGTSTPDASPSSDASIDAPPGARRCGDAGTGSTTGTIMGVEITPVVRTTQITVSGEGVAIVLDEVGGATCGELPTTGEHLALLFCATPTVGMHTVVDEQAFMCPGAGTFGLIEQNGSTDFAESTGGSITITSADAECVAGTFSINFMNEQLTGTFDAFVCP